MAMVDERALQIPAVPSNDTASNSGGSRGTHPGRGRKALGWVLAIFLSALVLYPILSMMVRALAPNGVFDWDGVLRTFQGYGLGAAVLNTVLIAVPAVILAVITGTAFAWLNERTDAALGPISRFLPILPMMFPALTIAIGWLIVGDQRSGLLLGLVRFILAPFGIRVTSLPIGISSIPGMIFLYAVVIIPFVYVITSASFQQLDASLEEMARLSGRGRFATFFLISLPSIRPAVITSTLLASLIGIAMFAIPVFIGTPGGITVLSVYIANLINGQYPPRIQEATVLGVCLVIVILLAWFALRGVLKQQRYASVGGRGIRASRIKMGRWKYPMRAIMYLYLVLAVGAPVVGLLIVSFQRYWTPDLAASGMELSNFWSFLQLNKGLESLGHSVWVSIVSATLIMIVAGLLAITAVGRYAQMSSIVVGFITKIPFAIPNIVLAIGVLAGFGFAPFNMAGTYGILILGYFVTSISMASVTAESAARQVSDELMDAARINGASPTRTMLRVSFPIMLSGLAAGWVMIFAHIIGDLNLVPILSGPNNPIAGTALLEILAGSGTYVQAAQISLIIAVITIVVVAVVLKLTKPKYSRAAKKNSRPVQ